MFHCQLSSFRSDEDNCSGQTMYPLGKKPASQSAALADPRDAEAKKQQDSVLKDMLSPLQTKILENI